MKTSRVTNKFVIAIGDVNAMQNLPVNMKKHIFQTSTAMDITPVLYSGADAAVQSILAGETWETTSPLSGFKSSAIGSVFWVGENE